MTDGMENEILETKCAIAIGGSIDSGKSSLVGVLSSETGELDDGNGSARKSVARHEHEIQSGKTSAIATKSYKSITLIDLCGHEAYFKTTAFGVSGHFPDYAFLIVSANRGILPMTKQHMRLLLSLSVPILIIVTHIDISPDEIYDMTKDQITKTCSAYGGKMATVSFVNNNKETASEQDKKKSVDIIINSLLNIPDGKQTLFPVVSISNKTGYFIDVIKSVMDHLTPRPFWSPGGEDAILNNKVVKLFKIGLEKQGISSSNILPVYREFNGGIFYCDNAFSPPGIGTLVSGINRGKTINIGDTLYLGPFGQQFYPVRVRSMHNNNRQNITSMEDHYRGCVAFASARKDDIKREQIGKGFVLLTSLDLVKNVCYRFKAVITLFTKSVTLKSGYSPVIHLYTIRQAARMTIDPRDNNGSDVITYDGSVPSASSVAVVTFKFKMHPEFIEPYNLFVLRSGDIQGIGLVISTVSINEDDDAKPDPIKIRRNRQTRKRLRRDKKN